MLRLVFGCLVPLLAIFMAWSFGDLPAKSVFWETSDAEITGYEKVEYDPGYGNTQLIYPLIKTPGSDTTLRLNVANHFDETGVREDWPEGTALTVRLHPDGDTAFPQEDERFTLVIPVIIALGGLMVMGICAHALLTGSGTLSFMMGTIGAVMMTVAGVLFYGLWTFGTPPATSFFWPTETVTVRTSEIGSAPIGNGNTNYFPVVSVVRDGQPPQKLEIRRSVFMTAREAREIAEAYAPGTTHSIRVAPDGRVFERHWQFQFTLALVITLMAPLLAFAGGFAILGAFRASRA
ncbi:hypothetical protein [Ponticaulis profundi]|uniref:DUF3592 domain-containing protein n=1 Tax=Ponticaulis profundi TaxID=2665222 RepID=A0ABW1S605_9PROT